MIDSCLQQATEEAPQSLDEELDLELIKKQHKLNHITQKNAN